MRILGSISLAVGGNRIIAVVNSSNSKGSALLHYVGLLRRPANKTVLFRNGSVMGSGVGVRSVHGGTYVIFRRFGLFTGVAILRGVACTPHMIGNLSGRRTGRGTVGLLTGIGLSSGTGRCPDHLDNNRGRHMTVTHTLTVRPGMLLLSRPASTLSPRVIGRMLSIVGRLTGANVAVILIARRVNFTGSISSAICFVSNNCLVRDNAPSRIFGRPGARHTGGFLGSILMWKGASRGVCGWS